MLVMMSRVRQTIFPPVSVPCGQWDVGGGLHALAVHDGGSGLDGAAVVVADEAGELVVEFGEGAVFAACGEVAVDRRLGWEGS